MSTQEFDTMLVDQAKELKPFAVTLTRDQEAAQDLYQETLCKALAHKDQYQPGTNIRAWLCTIMRHIFINEYRRNERKRVVLDRVQYAGRHNNYTFSSERNARLKEINAAIYRLPAIFKNACILYLEGYKYHEIAVALNEPLGTIKSRIHFARKLLQKHIDR